MMDHINTHFVTPDEDIAMSEPPLPEFISICDLKQEAKPKVKSESTAPRCIIRKVIKVSNNRNAPTCVIRKLVKVKGPRNQTQVPGHSTSVDENTNHAKAEVENVNHATTAVESVKDAITKVENTILNVENTKNDITVVENNTRTEEKPSFCTTVNDDSKTNETKVVRIVKLKRVKVLPRSYTNKSKSVKTVNDQKNDSSDMPIIGNIVEPNQPSDGMDVEPEALNELNYTGASKKLKFRRSCYQCEMEPKIWDQSNPRRHICFFCPLGFPNHIEFDSHIRTVHKKNPDYVMCKDFHCYVCDKKFIFREYLSKHVKSHFEASDHLCSTCGALFKTKSRLTQHMQIHEQDRRFECDKCGKRFNRFIGLRGHLWCHNTNLSFVCKVCSKAFKMKRYLERHMAMHEEPKINCRYCDAAFHFKTVRRAHEKTRHHVV